MPIYGGTQADVFNASAVPTDHLLAGWTSDPAYLQAGALALGGGTLQVARVKVTNLGQLINPGQVTNVLFYLTSPGVTLTSGRNFAGLYDDSGNLLSSTADQSASWGSTGLKIMALSAPVSVTPWTWYKVAWFNNGLTAPTMACGQNLSASALNPGLSGSTLRWSTANGSLTTALPSTVGTQTASGNAWWAALS